ncbi:hypothetical protein DBR39_17210 [Chryseobacterium sp. KBW03]|jgi:hypothetical protein|uniref:Uncharacterized protein n=1 Tax=Chryseobacterium viscerum TaxID=1037377 RepID=A0A316WJM6_9FLAO|nr:MULTISPECIES: hypothetical protein [Chryseobacterium]KAB1230304.1 hypothetical protein F8D52_14080 [Chryseobacterium viscerum]PWN61611.1 hypothetical protein C1634_010020 [Chryseobacterium viscerum]RQO36812.1 hypothetical protein DBR39_17210 [Chryseobacterium sp. KBW03]
MIHFTPEEKSLLLAAMQYEKEIQDRSDDEELEYVEEIEEEIQRENVFISRRQIDSLIIYLGSLLDKKDQYNSGEVLALESKLDDLSNLP